MRASPFGSEYVSVFQNILDFSHPSFFGDHLFLMHSLTAPRKHDGCLV